MSLISSRFQFSVNSLYRLLKAKRNSLKVFEQYKVGKLTGVKLSSYDLLNITNYIYQNVSPDVVSKFDIIYQIIEENNELRSMPQLSSIIFETLVRTNRLTEAGEIFERMKTELSDFKSVTADSLHPIFLYLLKSNKSDEYCQWFQWLKESSLPVQCFHINGLLSLSMNNIEELLKKFALFEDCGVAPNSITFNIILSSCLQTNSAHMVPKIVRLFLDYGVIPNSRTLVLVVDGFRKLGDIKSAETFFFEWTLLYKITPTPHMANYLLKAYIENNEFLKAQVMFVKLLERYPNSIDEVNRCELLKALYMQGQFSRLLSVWREILGSEISRSNVLYMVCYSILTVEKKLEDIVTLLRKHHDLVKGEHILALISEMENLQLYPELLDLTNFCVFNYNWLGIPERLISSICSALSLTVAGDFTLSNESIQVFFASISDGKVAFEFLKSIYKRNSLFLAGKLNSFLDLEPVPLQKIVQELPSYRESFTAIRLLAHCLTTRSLSIYLDNICTSKGKDQWNENERFLLVCSARKLVVVDEYRNFIISKLFFMLQIKALDAFQDVIAVLKEKESKISGYSGDLHAILACNEIEFGDIRLSMLRLNIGKKTNFLNSPRLW